MHRLPDGTFRFSPRDLISYLEGDFAAWCDRLYAESPGSHDFDLTPDAPDEEADLVIRRGLEHEAAHVSRLREREPALVEIVRGDDAHDQTREAMEAAAPIIVQGELRHQSWMGIADFLHYRDGFYEPWDTKLARSAKPYFLLQLSAYCEMLEAMQGHRPEQFGFVFGDGSEKTFKTDDVWHYYQHLKQRFEAFHAAWSEDHRPDAALDRTHGRWAGLAERILEQLDDLSLVAGITRSQMIRLRDAGLDTVTRLAARNNAVPRMNPATLEGLRAQASMQMASRAARSIKWEFRRRDPDRPRRGLALLPPPSSNDVFFDFEGFPYAVDGLEYLFGVVTVDEGAPVFRDWWAHDEIEERRAFEAFVDWVYPRWKVDPTMHVYHYAAYEKTALCRLMSKYGSREHEIDELLRHEVLVDLYPIVLQGLVIGTPSYSLKHVEKLYMPARTGDVVSASGSVVEYQKWLDSGESPDPSVSPILRRIRSYNKVDCESTAGLRDWLLERQKEADVAFMPPEAPASDKAVDDSPALELANRLLAREDRVASLLAWLLEFHRREEKPWWWRHFEQVKASDEKLYDDMECLAGLVRTSTPPRVIKRSTGCEYRFDPDQDTKMKAGDAALLAGIEGKCRCTIERFVDRDAGLIELKLGPGKSLPSKLSLIPDYPINDKPLREGILRFVTRWFDNPDCQPAMRDLLERRPPRPFSDGIPTTLCIQGPPGTGKTTTAAEMIVSFVGEGKRVGIVANGHQVVLNLLEAVAKRGETVGVRPILVKAGGDDDHHLIASGRIQSIESKEAVEIIANGPLVIGGTAWLFSRAELEHSLDYLFVEEAGQFSLANTIACGSSATSLILLGDQMQLSQPTQGKHPGESGLSALEYYLQGLATIPPELGLFLGVSHRMHPDVCRLISDAYYEGRLKSAPLTASNRVLGAEQTSIGLEAGIRFMPIDHGGCTQDSDEEVCAIDELVKELLQCSVSVKGSAPRPMKLTDILIVAPFNMQVRALKHRLGADACVGTVDKFQGKEAPVVIVSMCASTLDDAPRGAGFLLSRNRLNVAISRAQALAVVVGSAELSNVRVRAVEEMYLVSGWCRIAEFAAQ